MDDGLQAGESRWVGEDDLSQPGPVDWAVVRCDLRAKLGKDPGVGRLARYATTSVRHLVGIDAGGAQLVPACSITVLLPVPMLPVKPMTILRNPAFPYSLERSSVIMNLSFVTGTRLTVTPGAREKATIQAH